LVASAGHGKHDGRAREVRGLIPLKDNNPCTCFPFITIGLIAINLAVFVYELLLGPRMVPFVEAYGLIPSQLLLRPETLVSSMFLHAGLLHVGGNMLYLWIFGDNIESAFGHLRFLVLYLVFGVTATLVHALSDLGSTVPMVGASGAVAGVLGSYFLLYPRARVLTLFFLGFFIRLVWVPAIVVLGLWFVLQVINALPSVNRGMGGVAWYAHIGGFAAGVVLSLPAMRRVRAECARRERETFY
jgi:membrane associated rhomboid family serine protease